MQRIGIPLALCVLLAACGKRGEAEGEDVLPHPEASPGPVTGMPDPGVPTPHPDHAPPVVAQQEAGSGDGMPELPDPEATAPEDDPAAAVAVLRDYYAALNARDYGGAYRAWSDGGRASGQDPQQFAAGFDGTEGISVELGTPDPVEGAAGSRYVQVPVSLQARQADGSLRRYVGSHTLRRAVVDGATPEQASWRIASTDLREVAE